MGLFQFIVGAPWQWGFEAGGYIAPIIKTASKKCWYSAHFFSFIQTTTPSHRNGAAHNLGVSFLIEPKKDCPS